MAQHDGRDLCSPSSWGYESPSQLNREVTSILSKGNPPKTARSQFTHPEPGSARIPPPDITSRSNSCPLRLWGSESPQQPSDQSVELRNHLYQAALSHHSSPFTPPLRYPFLPPSRAFFPALPPGMDIPPLRQSFHPPFPFVSPLYKATTNNPMHPSKPKRKYSDDVLHMPGVLNSGLQPAQPNSSYVSPRVTSDSGITVSSTTSSPSSISSPVPVLPPYFKAGSMIQLASGVMKKVEDLEAEDFIESAKLCTGLSLEHATVARLEPVQESGLILLSFSVGKRGSARLSTSLEHPFFVSGHGWSSCSPSLTFTRYSLSTHQLAVGDICISLTHREASDLMPPPHTSPEITRECKQVRFQDSPTPKKRKLLHDSCESSETTKETPQPVSFKVRVSQAWESSQDDQRYCEGGRYSPLSEIAIGNKRQEL